MPVFLFFGVVAALSFAVGEAAAQDLHARLNAAISKLELQVIDWRRDFHQNPELSNREFRTSKIVAEHLKKLGMEVQTGVAKTGVVGVLRGGKPGPTIALRADMDG
ncbi:MAG: amidohydrolase, partial [Gammaproteobacteria bacterium]|nr:amidohydrolase [Gammaproteobacteria bacterium]